MVEVCLDLVLRAEDESTEDEIVSRGFFTPKRDKFIEKLLLVEADANPDTHSVFHNNLIFERHRVLLHDVKGEGKNLL